MPPPVLPAVTAGNVRFTVPEHLAWLVITNTGVVSNVTVGVVDNVLLQPVVVLVATILNVVVAVKLPVGKLIVPPVPATAVPTKALLALLRNW